MFLGLGLLGFLNPRKNMSNRNASPGRLTNARLPSFSAAQRPAHSAGRFFNDLGLLFGFLIFDGCCLAFVLISNAFGLARGSENRANIVENLPKNRKQ